MEKERSDSEARNERPLGRPVLLRRGKKFREKFPRTSFVIPSLITVGAIFCGMLAIVSAIKGDFIYAARCVLVAIILDGLDGRVARRLNATSAFGREFDSLSDVVSFGVAPAIMMYNWAFAQNADEIGVIAAFLFVVCGATRLARFNVLATTQDTTSGFVGLPIPGAAAAVVALVFCFPYQINDLWLTAAIMTYLVVISLLMVSTIPYLSIKKVQFSPTYLKHHIVFIAAAVAIAWKFPGLFLLAGAGGYALSGLVLYAVKFRKHSA